MKETLEAAIIAIDNTIKTFDTLDFDKMAIADFYVMRNAKLTTERHNLSMAYHRM